MNHFSKTQLCFHLALSGTLARRNGEDAEPFTKALAMLFPSLTREEFHELNRSEAETIIDFVRLAERPKGIPVHLPLEAIAEAAESYALPDSLPQGRLILVFRDQHITLVQTQDELNQLLAVREVVERAYVLEAGWVRENLREVWEGCNG